jgi:2-polyprenyl-6-methoxyphenol hydroxylase-like FAD-dependent oxidoreductase
MSPVGGVGINLAIQDAVAAANILAEPLANGGATEEQLRELQRRRELPTRVTQGFQVFAHKNLIGPALGNRAPLRKLPLVLRLLQKFAVLRRIPARMVGLGVRPEHIRTRDTLRR